MTLTLIANTAKEIMTPMPIAVQGDIYLQEAIAIMQENHLSSLPVVDKNQAPIGVLSQTDIVRHLYENPDYQISDVEYLEESFPEGGLTSFQISSDQNSQVLEVMSPMIFSVGPETELKEVVAQILKHKVHRIFVVNSQNHLAGVISSLDILKHLSA